MDRTPKITLYVGLFTAAYILLAFIASYSLTWLQLEPSPIANVFIIVSAVYITTFWFTRRENRHFTKQERVKATIGSIAADITIQVCSVLLGAPNQDLSHKWVGFLLIFTGHALLLVFSYSLLNHLPLTSKAA